MSKEKKKDNMDSLKVDWAHKIPEPMVMDILPAVLNAVMMSKNELLDFEYKKDETTEIVEIKIRCYKESENAR